MLQLGLVSAATALALVAIPLTAPSASAGTYPMRSCNVPGQSPASTGPWDGSTRANLELQ